MAKMTHSLSLKGMLHDDFIVEEFGKGDEPSEYYALLQLLEDFKGKLVSITIKEEALVQQSDEN